MQGIISSGGDARGRCLDRKRRGALLWKYARRLCGAVVRREAFRGTWHDDLANFLNLFLVRETARCPICGYSGTFLHHARQAREICVRCGSRARHRVAYLALERRDAEHTWRSARFVHFAPEPCISDVLRRWSGAYLSADLEPGAGDLVLDLRELELDSESVDVIFASHVLEHIVEDRKALQEIYRVLRPGGAAVLIVPFVSEKTVEFGFADPSRNYHARDCGADYPDRYRDAGFHVTMVSTDDFEQPDRYALSSCTGGLETKHWIAFCEK